MKVLFVRLVYFLLLEIYLTHSMFVTLEDNQEKQLLEALLMDYDPTLRPVLKKEDTVFVTFGLSLHQIIDVVEKEETIICVLWLRQGWNNPLLAWNETQYGGLSKINVDPSTVWKPDLVMYTNIDSSSDGAMDKFKTKIAINSSGYNKWLAPIIVKSACKIEVSSFPFDKQECPLKFGSWTFDGFKLDLNPEMPAGDFSKFITNGEWELVSIPAVKNVQYYVCCPEPYPDVTYTINISRRPLYFVFNLIIPCILIASLTGLSFFLPTDCGERIGLVITDLLALAMFLVLVADFLPSTSETIPLISRFFGCALFAVGISLVVTCVSLKCHFGADKLGEVPQWIRVLVFNYLAKMVRFKRKNLQNNRDTDNRFGNKKEYFNSEEGTVLVRFIKQQQPQNQHNKEEFTEKAKRNIIGFYPYDKFQRGDRSQDHRTSSCSCRSQGESQREALTRTTSLSIPRSISEMSLEESEESETESRPGTGGCHDQACFEVMRKYLDDFIKKQETIVDLTEKLIVKTKEEQEACKMEEEWKEVGTVLDTFFIYVFFATIFISAAVIFLPAVS